MGSITRSDTFESVERTSNMNYNAYYWTADMSCSALLTHSISIRELLRGSGDKT